MLTAQITKLSRFVPADRRRRRKRLADSWPDSPPSPYGVASPLNDLDNNKEVLGQYIHRIYCRECREQERMASGSSDKPNSPPQYQMDQLSLASTMDANRECKFHPSS